MHNFEKLFKDFKSVYTYVSVSGVKNVRFLENLTRFAFMLPRSWDSPFYFITNDYKVVWKDLAPSSSSDRNNSWGSGCG